MSANKCSLCKAPGTNKSTCPLNKECNNPKPSRHYVQFGGGLEFRVIRLHAGKEIPEGERESVKSIIAQYVEICRYQNKVKARKKEMFGPWNDIEDDVSPLNPEALQRLLPDGSELYNQTERVLIVCQDGDALVGFLGGVLNVAGIVDDPSLSSYDNTKYNITYDSFMGSKEDGIGLAWTEILCVRPGSGRGQGVGAQLIAEFERVARSYHLEQNPGLQYGLFGLDIVGTSSNGINEGLKSYYTKLGYDFDHPSNMGDIPLMFKGAQFAVKPVSYMEE